MSQGGLQMLYLDESSDWLAVCGDNVLVVGMHYLIPLCPGMQVLGHMQVDLVTIKIRIESGAVGVVHSNGSLTLHKFENFHLQASQVFFQMPA